MKWVLLLLPLVVVGCRTEEVPIRIRLVHGQCNVVQTEITQVDVFVLGIEKDRSLCTTIHGSGSLGEVALPPTKINHEEVVLLALAHGSQPCKNGDCKDGPPPIQEGPPQPVDDLGPPPIMDVGPPVPGPCGDGHCDPGEDCQSCPQDCCPNGCGECVPPRPTDGGRSYGLGACVRCYAITRLTLGEQTVERTLALLPAESCQVPLTVPESLGLSPGPLPPTTNCQ